MSEHLEIIKPKGVVFQSPFCCCDKTFWPKQQVRIYLAYTLGNSQIEVETETVEESWQMAGLLTGSSLPGILYSSGLCVYEMVLPILGQTLL